MMSTAIVAYLALFATVGFLFIFASLLLGRLLRASAPTPQKLETYECGEPSVGSGYVQFDLRFYVVALVFLIFEVEVALFFPPATVFGKAARVLDPRQPRTVISDRTSGDTGSPGMALSPSLVAKYKDLGIGEPPVPDEMANDVKTTVRRIESNAHMLALGSMLDLAVFFGVLLVGFAYVWNRGDLNWVRAMRHPTPAAHSGGER
jgi:NADH-quinone oxidoreductase subunit A